MRFSDVVSLMEVIVFCGIPFYFLVLGLWYVGATFFPNHFRITYVPFLNNELGGFFVSVMVVLILTLGCCTGFLLQPKVTSIFEISEEDWILLDSPPQKIKTLKAANFFTVYAETVDERLIVCYYESVYDNDCWYEIPQLPEIEKYGKCYRTIAFPEPPSSINVVDRINIEDCMTFAGMDDLNKSSYILSDNNQVYQNSIGNPFFISSPNLMWMTCLFLVMGVIIGLLIVLGLLRVNKRRNMQRIKSG